MENSLIVFVKYLWPVLSLPILWTMKQIDDLKKEHYETKNHAAENYISKADYREDLKTLHAKIDTHAARSELHYQKILDKLDNKADKK